MFSKWSPKATAKGGEKIVLFNDTFTEFNQPQVGIAAHTVLTSLGYEVIIPPWNCCGMAGSFGYEAEHYDISMKIGSLHLFPNIQSAGRECIIVANGFSCRSQIEHGTGHKAIHLAEFIASRLPPDPTK